MRPTITPRTGMVRSDQECSRERVARSAQRPSRETVCHRRESARNLRLKYEISERTSLLPDQTSLRDRTAVCRYIVLRRTKSPTPTAGPKRVATTSIRNDRANITQQTPHSTHPPRNHPPFAGVFHCPVETPHPRNLDIIQQEIYSLTGYSHFGHNVVSRKRARLVALR